jgi:hypothetical protein
MDLQHIAIRVTEEEGGGGPGALAISHETFYRHVAYHRQAGGELRRYLRGARKLRRRRAGSARRGSGLLRPSIAARPASVERRRRNGHWEIDTVLGRGSRDCILSLVERKTGYVLIGQSQRAPRRLRGPRDAADSGAAPSRAHHHGRQRRGNQRLSTDPPPDRRPLLLRHPISRLGTGDQ